uniref:Uncharacterized protein n=1 Tax=Cacopsylla melanoneura TaxID=428564 RepID=A0A8D9FJA8_9HEMI
MNQSSQLMKKEFYHKSPRYNELMKTKLKHKSPQYNKETMKLESNNESPQFNELKEKGLKHKSPQYNELMKNELKHKSPQFNELIKKYLKHKSPEFNELMKNKFKQKSPQYNEGIMKSELNNYNALMKKELKHKSLDYNELRTMYSDFSIVLSQSMEQINAMEKKLQTMSTKATVLPSDSMKGQEKVALDKNDLIKSSHNNQKNVALDTKNGQFWTVTLTRAPQPQNNQVVVDMNGDVWPSNSTGLSRKSRVVVENNGIVWSSNSETSKRRRASFDSDELFRSSSNPPGTQTVDNDGEFLKAGVFCPPRQPKLLTIPKQPRLEQYNPMMNISFLSKSFRNNLGTQKNNSLDSNDFFKVLSNKHGTTQNNYPFDSDEDELFRSSTNKHGTSTNKLGTSTNKFGISSNKIGISRKRKYALLNNIELSSEEDVEGEEKEEEEEEEKKKKEKKRGLNIFPESDFG